MRHLKKRHKLARGASHRKAILAALASALIEHKKITTTVAKAKALRVFVEPLLNRAKDDTMHNRRQVFRHLRNKHAVTELFDEVGPMLGDRNGGYTRIVKLGQRAGDSAEIALIELVDYNDVKPEGASGSSRRRRTRRSRRGRGSSESTTTPVAPVPVESAAPAEEEVATTEETPAAEAAADSSTSNQADEAEAVDTGNDEQDDKDEASKA